MKGHLEALVKLRAGCGEAPLIACWLCLVALLGLVKLEEEGRKRRDQYVPTVDGLLPRYGHRHFVQVGVVAGLNFLEGAFIAGAGLLRTPSRNGSQIG